MAKKFYYWMLALFFLWGVAGVQAQVNIGSSDNPSNGAVLDLSKVSSQNLGFLLPRVLLNSVSAWAPVPEPVERGMMVYNINTSLPEGTGVYVWDGSKWKKSKDSDNFTSSCNDAPVTAAGDSISCMIVDSDCNSAGAYRFSFISGSEFSSLIEDGSGNFILVFEANDQASSREVILLVTSPCGNSRTYAYTQSGDGTGCGVSHDVPLIRSENGFALCRDGAVYLYLEAHPAGVYIWTLNGSEVGRGSEYVATQSGRYIVYADKIGCPGTGRSQTVQVTSSLGSNAPNPVSIVAANEGYICSAGGQVRLYAYNFPGGTLVWYKDGVKTGLSGNIIYASTGQWFAVAQSGGCSSLPSNLVSVRLDPFAGQPGINPFDISANGDMLIDGFQLCGGGSANLAVINGGQSGVTYSWYINHNFIGTGVTLLADLSNLPTGNLLIRCRATQSGRCSVETNKYGALSMTVPPATPYITVNTPGDAICDGFAQLTANGSSGASYSWYFTDLSGVTTTLSATASSIPIFQPGIYRVSAKSGSCMSLASPPKSISVSGYAAVRIDGPNQVSIGNTKTYTAVMDNPQGASYTWNVSGASLLAGQGTSSILVNFPSEGTATIGLSAANACGAATLTPAGGLPVTVGSQCVVPVITNSSPASRTATIYTGQSTVLSITATGGQGPGTLTYQWYRNTVNSNSGGTLIVGATSAGYVVSSLAPGQYYYYCTVTATCGVATSGAFTVTVNDNPSTVNPGTGSFIGRTAFDVAMINDGGDCGTLVSRRNAANIYANFAETSANTQVYTFRPSSAVSNVRFSYMESQPGDIVVSMTPNADHSGNNITSDCNVTLVFNSNLNALASGRTASQPLTVNLYAIYYDGQGDRRVQLTIRIQDCAFCGGYANQVHTLWLTFMCYNLGADSNYSTPESQWNYKSTGKTDPTVCGDLYQWGRPADGHQSRTSDWTNLAADTDQPTHGKFIAGHADWRTGGVPAERWNDNIKKPNDPCPTGYRVPTQAQWGSLFRGGTGYSHPDTAINNSWTWKKENTPGYLVGNFLFLPAAGFRSDQQLFISNVGLNGFYWSSTLSTTNYSSLLYLGTTTVMPDKKEGRALGVSVRCVTEF